MYKAKDILRVLNVLGGKGVADERFMPLRLTNVGDGFAAVNFSGSGNIQYRRSEDIARGDTAWSMWLGETLDIAMGEYVEFQGYNETLGDRIGSFSLIGGSSISASGNVMSLVYGYLGLTKENILVIPYDRVFYELFTDCAFLITAPILSATTLTRQCYENMFYNCLGLTEAPVLPAKTLIAERCYARMFWGCQNLQKVYVSFSSWGNENQATIDWMGFVSPTGTFICPVNLPRERGASYIPENWRIQTFK